ncbi:StsA family sactipeptide RiPP [Streptomyces sp. NPDC097640]|uniref:StsA family sactipeptide RiPP n=1 Tax=Streptomyces sp. NPDC097640 TaxID=3157229 RepID=UPI0033322C50
MARILLPERAPQSRAIRICLFLLTPTTSHPNAVRVRCRSAANHASPCDGNTPCAHPPARPEIGARLRSAVTLRTNHKKGPIMECPAWVKPEMLPVEFDVDQPCSCDCSGGAGAGSGNAESEPRLDI